MTARPVLARLDSESSLSHSSSTTATNDLLPVPGSLLTSERLITPVEQTSRNPVIQGECENLLSPVQELRREDEGKKAFGKFKSMSSLRGKAMADQKGQGKRVPGRERAMSSSNEKLFPPSSAAASKPIPIPVTSSRPSRPKPQRSGSSFSSFIRKLTGRSASPPRREPDPVAAKFAPPRSRSTEPPRKPVLPKLDTRPHVPPVPLASTPSVAPASAPAAAPSQILFSEVDPLKLPLPPSPVSTPTILPEPDHRTPFTLALPLVSKRVKQTGMLSLEGFGFEEEDEIEALEEDKDVVDPLAPLRIPATSSGPTESPTTPVTASTTSDAIVTPTSPGKTPSPATQRVMSGSPSRKDSNAGNPGLGRKESKFRKSVMGLTENLNKAPPKPSQASQDAYLAQQRRIAANRVSRAPRLHSTASVAAEARQIADKEAADAAETFFLS